MLHRSPSTPEDPVAEPTVAKTPVSPVNLGGESFLDRLIPHMKKIVLVGVAVIAVLAVIFIIRWRNEAKRGRETEKLAATMFVASQPVRAEGATPDPAEPGYASRVERAADVLDSLAKKPTNIGTDLLRASMLFDAGKFDDALTAYQAASKLAGIDGILAREGLGMALEAKAQAATDAAAKQKGFEDALAAFRAAQPDDKGQRRVYALYHEARMLALLGKNADAKAGFEKAKSLAKGTGLEGLIEDRLTALSAAGQM